MAINILFFYKKVLPQLHTGVASPYVHANTSRRGKTKKNPKRQLCDLPFRTLSVLEARLELARTFLPKGF